MEGLVRQDSVLLVRRSTCLTCGAPSGVRLTRHMRQAARHLRCMNGVLRWQ